MEKSIFTKQYAVFLRVLRKSRQEAKLTQVDLAERLNQTQSFISKCERGERRLDVVELRAFCKAMGVDMADFIQCFERAIGRNA